MLTLGTGTVLQPILLGLILIPEKVKPHKVWSCCGAGWLCEQAYPQQYHPFSLLSITSQQIIPSADNNSLDRNTKAGSAHGSVAMATLAQKMCLSSTI